MEVRVIDGYKFEKYRLFSKGQKWRRMHREYTVSAFMNAQGTLVIERPQGHHAHLVPGKLSRQYVANSAKRKATDDITMKPAEMVRTEIQAARSSIRDQLKREHFENARRSIRRSRRALLPPLPTNIDESHAALRVLDVTYSNAGVPN